MLRRAALTSVSASVTATFAGAQRRRVGTFQGGKRTDIDTLLPKSKRPMNEAARQQLKSRLVEVEERQAKLAAREQALVERNENGEPAEDDEPPLEPTLDDLDISIPQVDCPFMAELVQRRLIARGAIVDAADAEADAAAAQEEKTKRPHVGLRSSQEREETLHERDFKKKQAAKRMPAKDPVKEREAASTKVAKTDGVPERTFRAPVEDDRENSGKEVVASSDALEGDKATGGDTQFDEPEPEPWRDEYEDGFVVIDVRSIGEIEAWGIIEGAKSLPAHDFYDAMCERDPDVFADTYGFEKPDKEHDTLILYCQYGPRSLMAAQLAVFLGFKHVMMLNEGYYEWAKQFNKLCRRYRLLDLENRLPEQRAEEFRIARGIGRDIAPEVNEIVDAEVDTLRLEESRSRGKHIHPVPASAEKLMLQVKEAKELEADLLNDPEYRASIIQQYDSEYPIEGATAGGPTALLPEPRIRSGPGTDAVNKPSEAAQRKLDSLDSEAHILSKAADAIGVPKAPTVRERQAESFGTRLLLAGSRRRKRKLTESERKVAADQAELKQAKKYPHKAVWRTH